MLPVLKFTPIYKSVLWGGTCICRFKGVASEGDTIGESWELSPMPGHESVVAEGPFAGRTLNSLVEEYPEAILGANVVKRFGANFPLLIKFIDSTSDLSIQVHPDDALAAKRHNSLGKTEMWYSVLPTPDAYLYAGFSQEMTPDKFRAMLADSTIVDALSKYYTKPGDVELSQISLCVAAVVVIDTVGDVARLLDFKHEVAAAYGVDASCREICDSSTSTRVSMP